MEKAVSIIDLIEWQEITAEILVLTIAVLIVVFLWFWIEIQFLKKNIKLLKETIKKLTPLLLIIFLVSCISMQTIPQRCCVLDNENRKREGWLLPERKEGLMVVQLDEHPKDGKHLLLLPNCFGTFKRPCVLIICSLSDPFRKTCEDCKGILDEEKIEKNY